MGELLVVEGLRKEFYETSGLLGRVLGRRAGVIRAVDGVSFTLARGEVLALVGESGSGKTTTGKLVVRLLKPTSGSILFDGTDISRLGDSELRRFRTRMQMIFQDPYASLDPRMSIGDAIAEPLIAHGLATKSEARRMALEALERVALTPPSDFYDRRPAQLSGGQRQRAVIARALILEPELIVADEPVSMVDVSMKASILQLLDEYRRERNAGVILITHDIAAAATIADRIAVMYLGKIVEVGPVDEVVYRPKHPYTYALLMATPSIARRKAGETPIKGEIADPKNVPPGCRFHPRCPLADSRCSREEPGPVAIGSRKVYCHYPLEADLVGEIT